MGNQPLQEGTNAQRKVLTTERPKICSNPEQPSLSKNISSLLLLELSRQMSSMVLAAGPSTMMSIEFLIPTLINSTCKHHQSRTSSTWKSQETQGLHHCSADKGVALVVMDKTEYITKCEAILQDNLWEMWVLVPPCSNFSQQVSDVKENKFILTVLRQLSFPTSLQTHLQLCTKNSSQFCKTTRITILSLKYNTSY